MATELIETGSTTAESTDITLADGESANIGLKGAVGEVFVAIQIKDDDAGYHDIGALTSTWPENRAVGIVGPGLFRVQRRSGTCGVFSA